jgi:DNA-binding IclR family transcriptional regulator
VRDILLAVMAKPGLAVGELAAESGLGASPARRAVKTLVGVGLLDQVRDGRYWRYFPGDAIASLSEESRARVREFKRSLVRDLQQEGLEPEVDVSPRGESVIAVSARGTRFTG